MKKLLAFWFWLDGKKTVIGASILLAIPLLHNFNATVLQGIWNVNVGAWYQQVLDTLTYLGNTLTTVGLLHKATKAVPDAPIKEEVIQATPITQTSQPAAQ